MLRTSAGLFAMLLWTGLTLPAAADIASTEEALADKVAGEASAPIEIIAYESLTCPHCAEFHEKTWPQIREKYVDTGKAKFVYRDFPFDGPALRAAMLARCAGEDRYFAMLDVLFGAQRQWATAADPMKALAGIGRLAGISAEEFDACMGNDALMNGILERRQQAQDDFGVNSTPTFIINGTKVVGAESFEEFDEVLAPMAE